MTTKYAQEQISELIRITTATISTINDLELERCLSEENKEESKKLSDSKRLLIKAYKLLNAAQI